MRIFLNILAIWIFFIMTAVFGKPENKTKDDSSVYNKNNSSFPQKVLGRSFKDVNSSSFYRSFYQFRFCEFVCGGKACSCCGNLNIIITSVAICGIIAIDPSRNKVEAKLTIGEFSIKIGAISFGSIYSCHKFRTLLSWLTVCAIVRIKPDYSDPNSFIIKAMFHATYGSIRFFVVTVSPIKVSGDIIVLAQRTSEGKQLASVQIHSPRIML